MSKTSVPPLHIEWTPGWVRATNTTTGERGEAASLGELGPIAAGQREAIVGVGHSHVFVKTLRLPKASPSDLRNVIGIQVGTLFPLPPDQISFDFIQTDDQSADGWLTVVAAIRSDDLKRIRTDLKQAGIDVVRVLPVALASAAVASRAGVTSALVAESDPSGIALDVVQDGILRFSRVAALSADPVIESQRTLAAARAGSLPIVTVGEIDLPGATPSLDSPLGLLDQAPTFNFELMEDRLRESKQRIAKRMRLAAMMLIASFLLILLVWSDRSDQQAGVTRAQGAWATKLTLLKSEATTHAQAATQVQTVQTALQTAFAPPQPLSDISAVVADDLPKGAWLTGVNVSRGKLMEARGTAKTAGDVTQFVNALGSSPRFRDVRLVFANTSSIGDISVIEFNVSAVCSGNPPMPVPPTKTSGGSSNSSNNSSATTDSTGGTGG